MACDKQNEHGSDIMSNNIILNVNIVDRMKILTVGSVGEIHRRMYISVL